MPDENLGLYEVELLYAELKRRFDAVKENYPELEILRRDLGKEDKQTLDELLEEILRLIPIPSLREEIRYVGYDESLLSKLDIFNMDILDFMSFFRNSGVKALRKPYCCLN